jgi:hypothetical protein
VTDSQYSAPQFTFPKRIHMFGVNEIALCFRCEVMQLTTATKFKQCHTKWRHVSRLVGNVNNQKSQTDPCSCGGGGGGSTSGSHQATRTMCEEIRSTLLVNEVNT